MADDDGFMSLNLTSSGPVRSGKPKGGGKQRGGRNRNVKSAKFPQKGTQHRVAGRGPLTSGLVEQPKEYRADFEDYATKASSQREPVHAKRPADPQRAPPAKRQKPDRQNPKFDRTRTWNKAAKRAEDVRLPPAEEDEDEDEELEPGEAKLPEELDQATTERLFGGEGATFADIGLPQALITRLQCDAVGFTNPTRVQQTTIPPMLRGRDVMVCAETGSGKTLAYLAPVLAKLGDCTPRIARSDGTRALLLTPTRELCLQVMESLEQWKKPYHWLVGGMLVGGENRTHEKARLRKGVAVLAATPGRLLDHLTNTAAFQIDRLAFLVLDEADRLLDMGFEEDLTKILGLLDKKAKEGDAGAFRRQTALLSATMNNKLTVLAKLSMHKPLVLGFRLDATAAAAVADTPIPPPSTPTARATAQPDSDSEDAIEGGARDGSGTAGPCSDPAMQVSIPKTLKQVVVEVPCRMRLAALVGLIRSRIIAHKEGAAPSAHKMVVFFSSTASVDFHHAALGAFKSQGKAVVPAKLFKLHGSLAQAERTAAFSGFKQAPAGILLCSDVAARGVDFPTLDLIVQFDPPGEAVDYAHRVGRTARLGQQGEAVLFLQTSEMDYVDRLQAHGVHMKQVNKQALLSALPALQPSEWEAGGEKREAMDRLESMQKRVEASVASSDALASLARAAFQAFVRAYAAFPRSVKDIFHPKKLHLGHVARSFGLTKQPSLIGAQAAPKKQKEGLPVHQGGISKKTKMDQIKAKKAASSKGASKGTSYMAGSGSLFTSE